MSISDKAPKYYCLKIETAGKLYGINTEKYWPYFGKHGRY